MQQTWAQSWRFSFAVGVNKTSHRHAAGMQFRLRHLRTLGFPAATWDISANLLAASCASTAFPTTSDTRVPGRSAASSAPQTSVAPRACPVTLLLWWRLGRLWGPPLRMRASWCAAGDLAILSKRRLVSVRKQAPESPPESPPMSVALRDLNLDADGRRIEVVANGFPFGRGADRR